MRIAYLDESGTPELTGNTSHFVLVALAIPGDTWKEKDRDISAIKQQFGLEEHVEIHAAWLNRRYEADETLLFDLIYSRGDTFQGRCVGVRHYRGAQACPCKICANH